MAGNERGRRKVRATCKICKAILSGTEDEVKEMAKGHITVHKSFSHDDILEELMDPEEYYEDPLEFESD